MEDPQLGPGSRATLRPLFAQKHAAQGLPLSQGSGKATPLKRVGAMSIRAHLKVISQYARVT